MSSSARLVVAAGFVAASIIAAAQLTRMSRTTPDDGRAPAAGHQWVGDAASTDDGAALMEPAELQERERSYQAIVERNVFRPLVSAPRGPEGVEAPSVLASDEELPRNRAGAAADAETRAQPPDPLADLALTGITQVGERLRALLEKVSTRTGRYVSVGEEFHGFRVVEIQADSVVLEKDGEQQTLSMGAKRLSPGTDERPAPAAKTTEDAQVQTPKPVAPRGRPPEMGEGFGPDMLAWAENMSLRDLERAYAQYSDFLSPEQRAQAEEYLQQRRARGR
jgi:hypothetical protein